MKLRVRFTAPKCCEDRPGGRSELSRRSAAESQLRQTRLLVVPSCQVSGSYRFAFRITSKQFTSEVNLRERIAPVISLFGGWLKAETVGEKSGERIPRLRTSRQRARMAVHGRCMRACTGLVDCLLGRESESEGGVVVRNSSFLRQSEAVAIHR